MERMHLRSRFTTDAQVAAVVLFFIIFVMVAFLWIALGPMMDVGAQSYNTMGSAGITHSEESRQVASTLEMAFRNYPIIALLLLVLAFFITSMRSKYSEV